MLSVAPSGINAWSHSERAQSRPQAPPSFNERRIRRSVQYGRIPLAMLENPQNDEGLWYAWMLRSHREGWTPALARQYFNSLLIGGPNLLTAEQVEATKRRFETYGQTR